MSNPAFNRLEQDARSGYAGFQSSGAPRQYSWLLAHGLIVTLVWLYVEFLRLFARLRD